MTAAKPAANLPKSRRRQPRYISAETERMLRDCFAGEVPSIVIADALRRRAIDLGRLDPVTGVRRSA
ncbi:hypothetical protein ACWGNN_00775 [Streptomyces sp. NPDC055817]